MRQRISIAIALACGPKLLFADEPTTALDVTVQHQILNLLGIQQQERSMAMVLVTHDLGVVAGRTDEILVMYAGKIVEKAKTAELLSQPNTPTPKLSFDPFQRQINLATLVSLLLLVVPPPSSDSPKGAL